MKTLGEFPCVLKVFQYIDQDTRGFKARDLDTNLQVPDTLAARMQEVEGLIDMFIDRPAADFGIERDGVDPPYDSALWTIAAPCDEEATCLMDEAGFSDSDIDKVEALFEDYFNGELTW